MNILPFQFFHFFLSFPSFLPFFTVLACFLLSSIDLPFFLPPFPFSSWIISITKFIFKFPSFPFLLSNSWITYPLVPIPFLYFFPSFPSFPSFTFFPILFSFLPSFHLLPFNSWNINITNLILKFTTFPSFPYFQIILKPFLPLLSFLSFFPFFLPSIFYLSIHEI